MANRVGSSEIDHPALLRRIKQPTLWINSTPRDMGFLRDLAPHAEQAWVIGAGHFPQLETPEQVNVLLRNFSGGWSGGRCEPELTPPRHTVATTPSPGADEPKETRWLRNCDGS